jgi:hypothetical protein
MGMILPALLFVWDVAEGLMGIVFTPAFLPVQKIRS